MASIEAKVLAELSEKSYSSGEAISRKLKVSRSAVWKHIVKLRELGYVIEASPRQGYRLAGRPDKLLALEVQPLLNTAVIGARIVHYDETGSTVDEARKLIDEGAPEGTVVIAEAQTRGRGRMGRDWQTPPGQAIALSVILYPRIAPARMPLLSLGTALAVKRAVDKVVRKKTGAAPEVGLKWPNDIYLGDRKLGGVLLEMSAEMDRVVWAIDSVGLNVNNSFEGTGLEEHATSLAAGLGEKFSRRDITLAILEEMDKVYGKSFTEKGLAAIGRDFEKHDLLQGHKVEVSTPDGIVIGAAAGIDSEGRLRVQGSEGKVQALFSGEATLAGSLPQKGQ